MEDVELFNVCVWPTAVSIKVVINNIYSTVTVEIKNITFGFQFGLVILFI